ncbi:MAG: cobaltochelatase subunit CobN, partial [Candidatus Methanomethylophilaceae archaeon]
VVVDHLPPAMARAGSYTDLESLDADLQAYFQAEQAGQDGKMSTLLDRILNRLRELSLLSDLGLPDDSHASEVRPRLKALYDYLSEIRSTIIKDGLHIFGTVPEEQLLDETVYSLVRLRNGSVPSIREAVAESMGCELDHLLASPSDIHPGDGRPNGAWLQDVEEECQRLVREWRSQGFLSEACLQSVEVRHPGSVKLAQVCRYVCECVFPGIQGTSKETDNLLHALEGGYVQPGPSGVPTRGNSHLLPSGRNFYSMDPASIPTPASWDLGRSMADKMVQRHVRENGKYPESVGMVVFATDTMKTGGDDIAYILWLMGLRPLWNAGGGKVTGIEVIPITELGRPRIDVTLRISGLFRDTFPHLMDLIDQGVEMVAALDESPQKNFICKHLEEDIQRSLREGMGENEARSRAKVRVFGCPPGTYGGGVGEMIESSRWSEVSDLGGAFVNWGCHAYGGGRRGERMESLFQERLAGIDVTVKNHCSRELDMLDNDDDFVYHGGMVAAVRSQKGESPSSFVGDSSDPERLKVRSTAEECRFIFRSRVMNPKWLQGLMRHGYRGVQELASLVDYSFAWGATADIMEPWMYQTLADDFLLEEKVQEWINDNNPYAMRHMTGRLLEAIDRSMWKPDPQTREQLESLYLDSDEFMESE